MYVNLVYLITQIMKLYESSSKVDTKVCFPEFACALYFPLFGIDFKNVLVLSWYFTLFKEKKRKSGPEKRSNKLKKPTNGGPKQLCLSKFFSTSKATA